MQHHDNIKFSTFKPACAVNGNSSDIFSIVENNDRQSSGHQSLLELVESLPRIVMRFSLVIVL